MLCALVGCNSNSGTPSAAATPNTLTLGASKTTFDELVATLGAKDVGQEMAMDGPTTGIIWEFADYDAVVCVAFDNSNTITQLEFCTVSDFNKPKLHRSRSTVVISQITFNNDKSTSRVGVTVAGN